MTRQYNIAVKWISVFLVQLISCAAFSQEIVSDPVIDKLKSYSDKAVQEKIFLHTDKEFYIAGEIVWFKMYYVNGVTHEPMELSKVAYVEILNDRNEPAIQAKISLKAGEKAGSFYLPTSMPTGYYTIKAYTNWMKNFDAAYFFEKKIAVVNTLKIPDVRTDRDSTVSIDFFPEGGNLVAGLQSKVGFKATGSNGSVNEFRGFVTGSNNDTVATFSPYKFGIGNFTFKPEQGNTYKATVVLPDGRMVSKTLPEVYSSGYVMSLSESSPSQVTITVSKRGTAQGVEQLVLVGHTRQKLAVAQKAYITNGENAVFTIDKNKIGKGITHFTVFNGAGAPISERLYFTKPTQDISLGITSDKSSYARREKIALSFNTRSASATDLSVSVFQLDSLQGRNESAIVDYMWLTSDLPGSIESPGWYFSNDPATQVAADNLMLTHGWRKFNWKDVTTGNTSFIKFLPEMNGHFVTGIVKDSRYDRPVRKIHTYLSVSGAPFGFYTSESNDDGFVYYDVKDYYGTGRVIAQPGIGVDSFYKVDVLSPFVTFAAGKRYPAYTLSEQMKESLLRKSIGMQAQNIYRGDSLRNFSDPNIEDTLPFFGRPEATYKLDDYKRFPTMEEVLREYVREVGVGARNETLIFKIFNPLAHDFYDSHSLVLLDGVAITDPNRIFRYDPFKVKTLDVIQGRYVLGHSIFNGIASFTTYEKAFDAYDLNTNLVAIDYAGLQLQRNFYSPVYETQEQLQRRIPDFRSTLYWAPHVWIEKDGKAAIDFYSSDLPGKYVVVAQGMDDKGGFVSESIIVEVK